jgi:hypothetical protein
MKGNLKAAVILHKFGGKIQLESGLLMRCVTLLKDYAAEEQRKVQQGNKSTAENIST